MAFENNMQTAYLASGCFWGTQFHLNKLEGIEATYVGYMGGSVDNPTYEQVKTGQTGHVETVMVIFDPEKINFQKVLNLYFETHNFEQVGGQGPDIGPQYVSKIFYCNKKQKKNAENTLDHLINLGYSVATLLEPATIFWFGEDYHQQYYDKNGQSPYCHIYKKIF